MERQGMDEMQQSAAEIGESPPNLDFMTSYKRSLVPKSGYNLVGPDGFEPPNEDLYLFAHYATREEAEAARRQLRDGGARAVIYGPKGE